MPIEPLHGQKKRKNLAIFFALLGFALIIFFVTIVRLKEHAKTWVHNSNATHVTAMPATSQPAASKQRKE